MMVVNTFVSEFECVLLVLTLLFKKGFVIVVNGC